MRHRLAGSISILLLSLGLAAPVRGANSSLPSFLTQGGRVRVGEEIETLRETSHPYSGWPGERAEKVWSEEIYYPGAAYIAPHFSRFHLAPGDSVIVRSPDGSRSWKYEGFGNGELGKGPDGFWGIHIPGETAVIELYSHNPAGGYGYKIDRFARGFRRDEMDQAALGAEAICGVDDSNWAKCYQSSEPLIYSKSRAVARLLIAGTSACTGWLLGSQGHVITNQHCIGSSTDAANTNFEFMAEGATCSTSCNSWFGCPGTVVATTSTLIKSDAPRDYALVKLPSNPTGTYGFLQFRSNGAVVDERIYVPQHPQAWGKRIAVFSTAAQDQSGYAEVYSLTEPACQTGGPADVGYFADTEGGSSGSPVLGYNDHLVVALHHCANCPNRGVPAQSIISHLGASMPAMGVGWTVFTTQLPAEVLDAGGTSWSVGNDITPSSNGTFTHLRYYKAAGEDGVHTLKLWNLAGTLLASGTADFGFGKPAGWVTVDIPDQAVTAGTTYRVSVTTYTKQSKTSCGLSPAITNGPLTASGGAWLEGDGVFPTTGSCSNFWTDVVFVR
ncbi:MAG TPA: DUF4082 domain-containing protein [Thermoanaerobaculia bacterium]|jgi:V8-like Glu-specific endopeptidase|nr:DUF4082 domain-containing protein [Thermoanaerobaculia bacterium]